MIAPVLNMEVLSKISLLFMGLGIVAGAISGLISNSGIALLIAIALFYVSYRIAIKMFLKKATAVAPVTPPPTQTGPTPQQPAQQAISSRKVISTGILPFFVMWLVFWIMVYSIKF
jgi:hypothetical protein